MIKFLDIYNQDKNLHSSMIKDIRNIFKKGDFILGEHVKKFENKFSNFCGSKFSLGCANGTDALTIALKALNLKKNSEVIIPSMTYCSTAFSIINANLKPVLVDVDFMKPTINIDRIIQKINKKTKVIMPVHLYGSVVDIKKIRNIIQKKKIYIIDDCAQAHGAKDNKGKKVGSLADISTFSLYPGKNLGAYGDAGIISTNNKKLYLIMRKLRNLGSEIKFKHELVGMNSRLDTLQAVILNHKLNKLSKLNLKRKKIADDYDKKINNKKILKLTYSKNSVYHQYVILVKKRNELIKYLKKSNIQYGFHYPYAIHELQVFKGYFRNEKFPNSEMLSRCGISLPIDPNLTKKQISYVINKLNSF